VLAASLPPTEATISPASCVSSSAPRSLPKVSHHAPKQLTDVDKAVLGEKAWPWYRNLIIVGLIAIIVAVVAAAFLKDWERLGFAYLIGYAFALSITLGCLFFVIITTLFRAGWCVAFRRVPETIAANMPVMGVLSIPILITVMLNNGALYPWAQKGIHAEGKKLAEYAGVIEEGDAEHASRTNPFLVSIVAAADPHAQPSAAGNDDKPHEPAHAEGNGQSNDAGHGAGDTGEDHAAGHGQAWTHTAAAWGDHSHATPYFVYKKGVWLTPIFFVLRWVFYIAVWTLVGRFFWKRSLMQDADGDLIHTHAREWWAPLAVTAFAVTLTLGSFDLLMSLDPVWYSTMYGVYFFTGCFTAGLASIIIVLMLGQRAGYFPAITTEHYHDLGKLLFAFVFFWGYIGFSQFMLIWYASLPETTYWWEIRGVTSVAGTTLNAQPATYGGGWTLFAWALLFGHLILPFAILLSKHVKRNRTALFVMACWMLVVCYIDIFWVAMPALSSPVVLFGLPEIGCVVFCVTIMFAGVLQRAKRHSLTAYNDPRMHESLALDTSAWAPLHH